MFIVYIVTDFCETITKALIKRRDEAVRNKDYDKAWKCNMAIDKWQNRTFSWSSSTRIRV